MSWNPAVCNKSSPFKNKVIKKVTRKNVFAGFCLQVFYLYGFCHYFLYEACALWHLAFFLNETP